MGGVKVGCVPAGAALALQFPLVVLEASLRELALAAQQELFDELIEHINKAIHRVCAFQD